MRILPILMSSLRKAPSLSGKAPLFFQKAPILSQKVPGFFLKRCYLFSTFVMSVLGYICMKNKKKLLIIIAVVLLTIFFVIPLIAFGIVNWGILPPAKLTPLITNEVNKHIQGELKCERIELTFLKTYPHLGIQITDGSLISHVITDSLEQDGAPYDSILHFSQATVSLRPLDYLTEQKITIGDVLLEDVHFHGYVDKTGKANWEIYESGQEDTASDSTKISIPTIDLRKVRIERGHFMYDDRQSDMYAEIGDFYLRLEGSLVDGGNTLAIETGSSSILFESPEYTLKNSLAIQFKSTVELLDNFKTVVLQEAEMMVNNLPFTADGAVTVLPDTKALGINLEMGLKASDMNDLLSFVPDAYFENRNDIKATGSVALDVSVVGELGENIFPTIDACCRLEDGSLYLTGIKQGIESLELDMDLHLNTQEPELSYVTLEKMNIRGLNTSLHVQGKATDILQSPMLDATVKGNIDFTRLAEEFLPADTISLFGDMDADLELAFVLDDLLEGRYNNVKIRGKLDIDTLKAFSDPYELDVFIADVHFSMDSAKMTSAYIEGNNLMNGLLTVDSMNIKYKEEINTNLSRLHMTAKTSSVIDTTAVMPVTSHIRVEQIRTRLPDSVWVVAKNTYLRGGIKPSDSNKQIPQFAGAITVDSLRYFDIPSRMGTILANSTFSLEAMPYRDAMRKRMQARRQDADRPTVVRDTTNRRSRPAGRQNRETVTDSVPSSTSLLRNWEVRGSVSFDQMRLFSRMFPLPMRMEKTKVKFDTNTIQFSDALFHAGKSNFRLTGEVNSIRRAMLRGGKLKGTFSVSSDYIDCNQLLQAVSRGMLYAEEVSEADIRQMDNEQLTRMNENALQDSITTQAPDSTEMLFVVPAFLDMSLVMDAKQIDYNNLKMENVSGEIVMRNQSINLRRLGMHSNIGDGNFSMYYASPDKKQANVGIDLNLENILVEKLLDLYPSIDSLLPMLRSFEGVVDCQLAVSCDVDSTTSVILPSLTAGCYVHGKNMVLLDGETFAEISKTLMFKNKERNQVDSISVDLAIRDSKIEIYPFLVEIDRYRVAVGGTHNLDMTFDYHVSVLKSPVPFKLGIDVTGNLDKFKYKITKCKYKDIFQPANIKELEASRSNLRSEMKDYIRKRIIENAPELAVIQRSQAE